MDREVIEKIEQLANPLVHRSDDGYEFVISKEGGVEEIRLALDVQKTILLTSLDALVKMIKTEALEQHAAPLYIAVSKFNSLICFKRPDPERRFIREMLYEVEATDVPGWDGETALSFEQALIAVRTRFQHTTDADYLLALLSEISCGAKITFADNGIATTVVSQKGVALQENAVIRPFVKLKPYRTFQEIEQPTSEFHIRISESGIRFIESDGGMWKLEARKTILGFLDESLADEIESGKIVTML